MEIFDALHLARLQFAFTVSFHIVFPAISIGMASFLAVLEWRWLLTGDQAYKDMFLFWSKIDRAAQCFRCRKRRTRSVRSACGACP